MRSFCVSLKELFVEHFARQACNQATKEGRINISYDDLGKCGMLASAYFVGVHTCTRGGGACMKVHFFDVNIYAPSNYKSALTSIAVIVHPYYTCHVGLNLSLFH